MIHKGVSDDVLSSYARPVALEGRVTRAFLDVVELIALELQARRKADDTGAVDDAAHGLRRCRACGRWEYPPGEDHRCTHTACTACGEVYHLHGPGHVCLALQAIRERVARVNEQSPDWEASSMLQSLADDVCTLLDEVVRLRAEAARRDAQEAWTHQVVHGSAGGGPDVTTATQGVPTWHRVQPTREMGEP